MKNLNQALDKFHQESDKDEQNHAINRASLACRAVVDKFAKEIGEVLKAHNMDHACLNFVIHNDGKFNLVGHVELDKKAFADAKFNKEVH